MTRPGTKLASAVALAGWAFVTASARAWASASASVSASDRDANAAHGDATLEASPAPPAPCSTAGAGAAPDPRCGEALDGRAPAAVSDGLAVPRAMLWVPRAASRVVLWPVVEGGGLVEHHRLIGWATALLTSDDQLVGVRPELQYTTGFLPAAGLRLFYRRLPGAGSEVAGRFLTAGPSVLIGELGWHAPAWTGLSLRGTFTRRDDNMFAGLGPQSEPDLAAASHGLARYGADLWSAELRWSRSLPAYLAAGVHADVQRRDYNATSVRGGPSVAELYGLPPADCAAAGLASPCVSPSLVPGFTRGLRVAHAGVGLALDARGHQRDGAGVSVLGDATFAQGLAGDPSRHVQLTGEVVGSIGWIDRVLILRARGAALERLTSAPIPFDELVAPAGSRGMRGFADGRFRGASGIVATAEYRYFIASTVDAALFTDVGTVAGPRFSGLRWDRWFPSFGVGFRLFTPKGPHWEAQPRTGVQLAYAPDAGWRVMLSLAPF